MKKHIVIFSIGLLTLIILVSIFISKSLTVSDPYGDLPKSYASWAFISTTSQELIEQADIIGLGKVVDNYTGIDHGIVFTCSVVEFNDIYMLSNNLITTDFIRNSNVKNVNSRGPLRIELIQTGGIHNEYKTRPFEDDPLLEIGRTYVLFLKKAYVDHMDIYWILGGHQGVAHIERDKIHFPTGYYMEDFSDLNIRLTDFTDKLQEFNLDQNEYVINTERKSAELFVNELIDSKRKEME